MDYVQRCLYIRSPSLQTFDGCVCNWLMSTDPDKLIATKLSFQMNDCRSMMNAFVLDTMLGNVVFCCA